MRCSRRVVLAVAWLVFASGIVVPDGVRAQGVTTSTVSGIVTDTSGVPIEGATIVALHTPTSTQYRALSTDSGIPDLASTRRVLTG